MKKIFGLAALVLLFISCTSQSEAGGINMEKIKLPEPEIKSKASLEETIQKRRSVRSYLPKPLNNQQVGQLLWAAQGITDNRSGFRAAPSAGATYPMEIYVAKDDGLYHYLPNGHILEKISSKDLRGPLASACYGQGFVAEASVNIIISAIPERTTESYGHRGIRYIDMEAGHIAQNIHLQAVSLGLASVPVGAFNDSAVKKVLSLPRDCEPVYIIPVGYKR